MKVERLHLPVKGILGVVATQTIRRSLAYPFIENRNQVVCSTIFHAVILLFVVFSCKKHW